MIRGGGIVMMPMGRRSRQIRKVQRVVIGVLVVVVMLQGVMMLQSQMHAQPEGCRVGRHPAGQDQDRDRA